MKRSFGIVLLLALLGATPTVNPSLFGGLHWRLVGPTRGGRALAVAGVPGNPNLFYFGAVNGGIWKTENAGRTWSPIFDKEPIGSIGAIAVAPSDPNVIYVGSGEADMRSDIAAGNGMYVSTDAGATWKHSGLNDSEQIGKIVVDPHDAKTAYVAALGHQYGPNAERGVFKTTDGGASWSKVLFKNVDTGAIDLAMDPSDPNTVYASLWQTRRPPWNVYPPSNGPGSGIYVTHDGGTTWSQFTNGLPKQVGRTGLTISAANPKRIYAFVDTGTDIATGGIYRSDDSGATWKFMDGGRKQVRLWQRGWYFGGITADPNNADIVYVMDTATYRSTDGGASFVAIKGSPGGDDYHTLWIDPQNSARMELASDQGVVISVDDAQTWSSWYNQPTAQFYHVAVDNRFPYWLYGAQQDSGAIAVPSRSKHAGITQFDWQPIDAGGESGSIAADPVEVGRVIGSTGIDEDINTGAERVNDATTGYPETLWRSTWTLPITFSPVDRALYATHQQVFRSRDKGRSWQIISPDLTRPNAGVPSNLDASAAADNLGITRRGVVYSVAPSPLNAKLLWAGTDDGFVWITRDGGTHWHNITPAGMTAWSKVGIIEASHRNPAVAYLAVDRHRLDDFAPYIYRTSDYGAHWTSIVNGIPHDQAVNVVREDPKQPSLLYAGTERGVFVSFNTGESWQPLQLNLPVTSVRDVVVAGNDVAIATFGRGFYIIDDAKPLRAMNSATARHALTLFAPATTYRMRAGSDQGTPVQPDEPQTENPVAGVAIDYALASHATTPVVITIRDAHGATLRTWSSADTLDVPNASEFDLAPRWLETPPAPSADAGAHRWYWTFDSSKADGPLVPPGRYTVAVSANGRTVTQPVTILRDPRLRATDADLRAQYTLAMAIQAKLDTIRTAQKAARTTKPSPAITAIMGTRIASSPDDSEGKPQTDLTTLLALSSAYRNLEGAVAGSDAAPTHDMLLAYAKLNATTARRLAQLHSLLKSH